MQLTKAQAAELRRLQSSFHFRSRGRVTRYRPLPNGKFEQVTLKDEETVCNLFTVDGDGKAIRDLPWLEGRGPNEEAALTNTLARAKGRPNPELGGTVIDELEAAKAEAAALRARVRELEKGAGKAETKTTPAPQPDDEETDAEEVADQEGGAA